MSRGGRSRCPRCLWCNRTVTSRAGYAATGTGWSSQACRLWTHGVKLLRMSGAVSCVLGTTSRVLLPYSLARLRSHSSAETRGRRTYWYLLSHLHSRPHVFSRSNSRRPNEPSSHLISRSHHSHRRGPHPWMNSRLGRSCVVRGSLRGDVRRSTLTAAWGSGAALNHPG